MHTQLKLIAPGSIWEHTKSNAMCTVLYIARSEASQELVVVYRHVHGGDIWTRPVSSWLQLIDGQRQRFEWRSAP